MNRLAKIGVQLSNCFNSLRLHYKITNKTDSEKYILIPLFGMIGDAIIFLDALRGYQELFPKEKGYHIIIGCRPQVKSLLDNIGLDEQIEVVIIDRGQLYIDAKELPRTIRRLSEHYYELIINVRERRIMEDILLYALPAKRKITFRNSTEKPDSIAERFFFDHTYDEIYYADMDSDQYRRYGKLLHVLGHSNYRSHVSRLPQIKEEHLHNNPYCVICPSSSAKEKCWPADRFATIADAIINEYGLDICFTGSKTDSALTKAVISCMQEKKHVYDFTGKTSMNGWIELIREAKLVISNDSASIHIAAAVQTKSVCIAPQHDGLRFLPYRPDIIASDDVLPIPIRCKRVNCFDCQLSNRKSQAQADPECQRSIKRHGTYKCIYSIPVQPVLEAVRRSLENRRDKKINEVETEAE